MSITNAALTYLAELITGTGLLFNEANAAIGVGSSNAAVSASHIDLHGASKVRKGMDAGYPVVSNGVVTFKSTFLPAEANFAWEEYGIFNATLGGTMLNRFIESNGTKLSNQTWILEVDVSFTTT